MSAIPLLPLGPYAALRSDDYHPDPLLEAIDEQCIRHEAPIDYNKNFRLSAKAVCLLASATAKIPYAPIALKLPAGPIFVAGNTSSFFLLEQWAIRGTIKDLLGPKGSLESFLIERAGKSKCYQTAMIVSSLILSFFSQIPTAFPTLDYDGKLKIPGFVVVIISGSLIPIRSLQLTIDKTFQTQCMLGGIKRKIEEIREETLSLVQEYRTHFRKAPFEEKLLSISALRNTSNAHLYLSEILTSRATKPLNPLYKYVSFVIGSFLTASFDTALTMYTWSKTKEHIADNDGVAALFAIITGTSWLYLTGKSITKTTQRFAEALQNLIIGHKDPSIAEQIHPKLVFSFKAIGLINNVLALGPTIVIWSDFYKDNPSEQKFFVTTLCITLFLLLSTATFDLIEEYVEGQIQDKGTIDQQNIIKLDQELRKLESLFQQSSLLDFTTFLLKSPINIKKVLLKKVALSIEELSRYVESIQAFSIISRRV